VLRLHFWRFVRSDRLFSQPFSAKNIQITGMFLRKEFIYIILSFLPPSWTAAASCGETQGVNWPGDRAFPRFAEPIKTLDGLVTDEKGVSNEERVMWTVFQGLVNKVKPSVFLLRRPDTGMYEWPEKLGLKIKTCPLDKRWELIKKYQDRINGLVLYSSAKSSHYRNLASTVAGLRDAIPVTAAEYKQLRARGIDLPVLEDLSGLHHSTPEEIYRYLYNIYWEECGRRVLVHHNAAGHIRDIAAVMRAAVIWLDPRKPSESEVLRLFLKDMPRGKSLVLGWWPEERSGVGIGTEYGIATVPADFYDNATVYAGMSSVIDFPVIPKKPELKNKIYITISMSDGDNIQYCQHTLFKRWQDRSRGDVPINWTVSPALVDLGPALLNYYYKTATKNDFFACGPSGIGYALPYDAHNKKWHNSGGSAFDEYLKLTNRYLERSGLRVITIWDQINKKQMASYATHCRYLYGVTQQDWEKQEGRIPAYGNSKGWISVLPNLPCYASDVDAVVRLNRDAIRKFNGTKPLFLPVQVESWKMTPEKIVELKQRLERLSPGNVVFCRGDHFFALHNEADGLAYDLTLSSRMVVTSGKSATPPAFAADGSCAEGRTWMAKGGGAKWLQFDFKNTYQIKRYVIRHAGAYGADAAQNTREFEVETSRDDRTWERVGRHAENTAAVTDVDIAPVRARYARINITDAGADGVARIADVEIYGRH
jgi:hypothetical protein